MNRKAARLLPLTIFLTFQYQINATWSKKKTVEAIVSKVNSIKKALGSIEPKTPPAPFEPFTLEMTKHLLNLSTPFTHEIDGRTCNTNGCLNFHICRTSYVIHPDYFVVNSILLHSDHVSAGDDYENFNITSLLIRDPIGEVEEFALRTGNVFPPVKPNGGVLSADIMGMQADDNTHFPYQIVAEVHSDGQVWEPPSLFVKFASSSGSNDFKIGKILVSGWMQSDLEDPLEPWGEYTCSCKRSFFLC